MAWAYTKGAAVSGRTATTTAGSTSITISSSTGILRGHLIEGPGIPDATVVTAISGTTLTLSQAATAPGAGVAVTFSIETLTQSATDNSWAGMATASGIPANGLVTVLPGSPTTYQLNRGRIAPTGTFTPLAREGKLVLRPTCFSESTFSLGATADVTLDGRAGFGSPSLAGLGLVAIESHVPGSGGFSGYLFNGSAGAKLKLINCGVHGAQSINLGAVQMTIAGLVTFTNPTVGTNGSGAPFSYNAATTTFESGATCRLAGGWRYNPSRTGDTSAYLSAGRWQFDGIGATQSVPRLVFEGTTWENSSGSGIALRDGAQLILDNTSQGSQVPVSAFAPGVNVSNKGIVITGRTVSHTAKLADGTPLAGAVIFAEDLLDGNEANPTDYIKGTVGGTEYDFRSTNQHLWVADAAGEAAGKRVPSAYIYLPSSDAATLKRCVRVLNGGADEDQLNFLMLHYAALPQYTPLKLRAITPLAQAWNALPDADATLSESVARAKLAACFTVDAATQTVTVISNSDYDDLYCALKAHKCSASPVNIKTPSATDPTKLIVTPSGDTLSGYDGWTLAVNAGVTLGEGAKFKKLYFPTVAGSGSITGAFFNNTRAGTISVIGVGDSETVEMRLLSDGSLIATRTGPGAFAVSPTGVGTAVYFVRLSGTHIVASNFTRPVTLVVGVNEDVPLFSGAEVQVAQIARIDLIPTLAEIEAPGTKLDIAMKAAKAAKRQTL